MKPALYVLLDNHSLVEVIFKTKALVPAACLKPYKDSTCFLNTDRDQAVVAIMAIDGC